MSEPTEIADSAATIGDDDELGVHRSMRADVWRQFRRHRGAMVGLTIMILIILFVTVGPLIYAHDPFEIDYSSANQGQSWKFWAGTEELGRSVMARSMFGGRVSLAVGFTAMFCGLVIGVTVGLISGFIKLLDWPLMALTDLFLALPLLPLLLFIMAFFREPAIERFGQSLGVFLLVVFVIAITTWMQTARVVRGDVLAIKEEEFVVAARSIGIGHLKIMARHLLPNVISSITVSAALGVATAILTESAISFLGFGFPAEFPTWGSQLSLGQHRMSINIWRTILPGALITLTVLSINFIGDGLRDALDPRSRK